MAPPRTTAERLDHAIDAVLDGAPATLAAAGAGVGPAERSLVDAAVALRDAVAGSLVAPRFEGRLGSRLAQAAHGPWFVRHPGRLIVTGAVGSAVGVGVTAYAVWRSTRRGPGAAHRLLHL
jgi:hypothetical protein